MAVIHLKAARNEGGGTILDEVEAEPIDADVFRVSKSPGLVLGVAAGDVIQLDPDFEFHVVSHGGNVAVQIHAPSSMESEIRGPLAASFAQIGGVSTTLWTTGWPFSRYP